MAYYTIEKYKEDSENLLKSSLLLDSDFETWRFLGNSYLLLKDYYNAFHSFEKGIDFNKGIEINSNNDYILKESGIDINDSSAIVVINDSSILNNYDVLDAREFGLPQARERVFTISCLNGEKFDFTSLIRTPMRKISDFLEDNENVPEVYNVTQPSVYNVIGASGIKRATVIKDFAYTITTRQDRTPAQVIDCGSGRYRYLTERECWRLMGYTDEEFEAAKAVHERKGRYYMTLYKQAGNSIAVPIFESIFRKIILGEEKRKKDDSERQEGDAGR